MSAAEPRRNPIEYLRVDGVDVDARTLAVPDMNLSSATAEMVKCRLVMRAHAPTIIARIAGGYEELVREFKADDKLCGGPQDDLARAGYPTLIQLMDKPKLLRSVVGHFLREEWLAEWIWSGVGPKRFWLDRITECRTEGDYIVLTGDCYVSRQSGAWWAVANR